LEIICVDDGSTDNSGNIADEYAARDARINVIHKINGGLPSARKAGIAIATGEYILHLDGDDNLPEKSIEDLLLTVNRTGADICVGNSIIIDEVKNVTDDFSFHPADILSGVEYMEAILRYRVFNIWGKLIRRDIYSNKIELPEYISCGEDLVHLYQIASYAKKVAFCNKSCYTYYIHKTSMSNENGIWGSIYNKSILASFFLLRLAEVNNRLPDQKVLKDYMATEIYYYFLSPYSVSLRRSELQEIISAVDLETILSIKNRTKRVVLLISKLNLKLGKCLVSVIKSIRHK